MAGISKALRRLPLFNEPFIGMQALNLDIVDDFLRHQEEALRAEYMEMERTPVSSAVFVSALSQLWIFGMYKLLRTWRQRSSDILNWGRVYRTARELDRPRLLTDKKTEIHKPYKRS
jgi:hypothetical protein